MGLLDINYLVVFIKTTDYYPTNTTALLPDFTGGLFEPVLGGHFEMGNRGHFAVGLGGQFAWFFHPIDITKFINCFSSIPDEGSTCSIEIFSDIPVDKDPNKLFNWQTQSPGHTFLQIKKTNGNQLITQNIGFYPLHNWKLILTTAPIEGKFVDNGEHEFNASLKMSTTPEDLSKALTEINYLANFLKYDIDEFNCTDFALDVFNKARTTDRLEIPKYDIPGGTAPDGTNTPQGLYNKLKSMQQLGMESSGINIPVGKGYVADSNGPCN